MNEQWYTQGEVMGVTTYLPPSGRSPVESCSEHLQAGRIILSIKRLTPVYEVIVIICSVFVSSAHLVCAAALYV